MRISSQNLMPMPNFLSTAYAKPLAVAPTTSLQAFSPAGEPIVDSPPQTKPLRHVSIVKAQWPKLDAMMQQISSDDSLWVGQSMVYIMRAISGGPGSPEFVQNDDGSYSGENQMQNFLTGMENSGDQLNAYIDLSAKLAGKFGSGEKDLNTFTSFAAKLSSDDLQIFLKAYQVSPVTLTGETGKTLMDFAVDLSGGDMKNFITAVHNSPSDMPNLINTAAKLSKDDLSSFLTAAANTGEDVAIFIGQVDASLAKGEDGLQISSYLAAAAKTGDQVIDFVNALKGISTGTTNNITTFITSGTDSKADIQDIVKIIKTANEGAVDTIIDVASGLAAKDRGNLLDTAARAGNNLAGFVNAITEFSSPDSGRSAADFSNFLSTASKAEDKLGILVTMSSQLDLSFTSTLSAVDTVNFLDAAQDAGGSLAKLNHLSGQLSGSDRSNFLYAAAQSADGLSSLLHEVGKLAGDERSQFLRDSAHKGQEPGDEAVYMKGILATKEYEQFQKSATIIPPKQLDDLVEVTTGLTGTSRTDFLETAAASRGNVDKLVKILKPLSQDDQQSFVDLTKGLGKKSLEKLIKAGTHATEEFSNFISLAKDLKASDRTGFDYFLSAAEDASPKDLKDLVTTANKLGARQQTNNRSGVDMRHSFLMVASDAGHNLSGVIDMANNLINISPGDFVEIFDSAEAATSKYLGTFIKAYV